MSASVPPQPPTPAPSSGRRSDALLASLKTLHPMLIDLSLGRLQGLLAKLGHPERALPPVVHIAGTNGKGSTTAFLRAITEAAGKRALVYTSPHLVHFHERISLPGADGISRPIGEDHLIELLERVKTVNGSDPMTFFEITTAAAFLAFREVPADVLLLEVGLGGEFDGTNVIDRPALAIITPVSMDHAEKLGATLPLIASAKAGILKRDCPAIISAQEPDALDVIRAKARAVRAPIEVWGEDFDAYEQNGRLIYQTETTLMDLPLPGLVGRHQIVNAGAAVAAAARLRGTLGFTEEAIGLGIAAARWPARMQRLKDGPLAALAGPQIELWLDGGHNPAGGQVIAQTLADMEEKRPMPLVMVAGMMGLKDSLGFLTPFRGLAQDLIAVPIPGAHEKPHEPADLAAIAIRAGIPASTATSVPAALQAIARRTTRPTRVLVTGSLYLAGHVLALQAGTTPQSN
jgi:dihydrofolate synthase / folylpolyglutamate synthase